MRQKDPRGVNCNHVRAVLGREAWCGSRACDVGTVTESRRSAEASWGRDA